MLYRRAGIRHTDYASDRELFPIPADRIAIAVLPYALATGVASNSAKTSLAGRPYAASTCASASSAENGGT